MQAFENLILSKTAQQNSMKLHTHTHGPCFICVKIDLPDYVHWTRINVNKKDVHASMISFNGKIYIKNMDV